MLHVGLTGGIGSGKSSVARRLAELGAVVVDADQVARDVVAKGEPALAAVVERFGPQVLRPDGELDRPALGRVVFADPEALRALEGITHPAVWERTARLREEAAGAGAAVLVHDMPLLVEKRMSPEYHLVVVVDTPVETRVRRLVEHRGMPEEDARARMRSQADDEARRAAADVVLDNDGTPQELLERVDRLWRERLAPFAENLRTRTRSRRPEEVMLEIDPAWRLDGARVAARVQHALGGLAAGVDHIGSTAVPGLPAKDVFDLQVGVRQLSDADRPELVGALDRAGYPRVPEVDRDRSKDGEVWHKRFHSGSDPGQVVHVHVREVGSPGWVWALRFRDWLRADAAAREDYAAFKRGILTDETRREHYPQAKEPWFDEADDRARAWAERTAWSPGERGAGAPETGS
ncbi:dephospho-CoA kinase [Janibacter melonis]|uniref:Dephospho-CoA kinase n=1 Tax=Janibacter melonis TaxID=262209 RepID=A0A176QCG8_9MICO|nr:dephospho-CoA kinase [Janibacter melonis]OAB87357.1 dephospho-CoA kinase [Janibacter melonis]